MKIYLHIGYPKTGSSAIQSHIFANRGWLEQRRVYVPRYGFASGKGHAYLLDTSAAARKNHDPDTPAPGFLQVVEELSTLAEGGFDSALISWEGFARCDLPSILSIAKALSGHRVILLAYVRDQVRLFESSTLQHIKKLRMLSGNAVVDEDEPDPAKLDMYDFAAGLALWEQGFAGDIDIRTRVFEKSKLEGGNVVLDFLSCLGLTPDNQFALQSGSVNTSLDTWAAVTLMVAHTVGLHQAGLQQLSGALSKVRSGGGSAQSFLSAQSQSAIRAHFRDSNARLFHEFRPENVDASDSAFSIAATTATSAASKQDETTLVDYMKMVRQALLEPAVETWDGALLTGLDLGMLSKAPSSGWRGAEPTGVWSIGPCSSLNFRLPTLNPEAGPRLLRLVIRGHYRREGTLTQVTAGDYAAVHDLTRIEIDIPLDDTIREQGLSLLMEQRFSASSDAEAVGENDVVFKLRAMAYSFEWD